MIKLLKAMERMDAVKELEDWVNEESSYRCVDLTLLVQKVHTAEKFSKSVFT